jgi:ABC-type multidrug transport system fused ATPase/permease subunit
VSGFVEAAFLVACTKAGLAVARGDADIGRLAGRTVSVWHAIVAAVVLLCIRLVLGYTSVTTAAGLSKRVLIELRSRLAASYLAASWSLQQSEPTGALQTVSGLATSAVSIVTLFVTSLGAILSLLSFLLMAGVVNPLVTVLAIVTLASLGRLMAPLRRRIGARSRTAIQAAVDYGTRLAELSTLGLEMQTFGVRHEFAGRLDALSERHANAQRRAMTLNGMLTPMYTTLAYGGLVVGLAAFAASGARDLDRLGAVMLLMLRCLSYGQQLQSTGGALMSSLPALERYDATLERYDANRATDGLHDVRDVQIIEADDIGFAYVEDRPVLSKVSFHIEPGEIVGVVGPSGAGKSTLVQLLLGLHDPSEGSITIDGVDLRQIDRRSWHRQVSFVAQDARLFTGTVAENIRFFRGGIDDESLRLASDRANLTAEIEQMPNGFDTFLGERGGRLSGGQRQRLSIARALAGRPRVLILDEPTSALDVNSEALIRATLDGLRGEVTTIVIAHRMSTLDICDRIMVIESGRLTAFGPPSELAADSEFYRHALELSGIT